jgi:chromosome segregation ATPase
VNPKLIAYLILAASIAGAMFYVHHLKADIEDLTTKVASVTVERDTALAQVKEITSARDEVAKKQALAETATAQVKAELSKARARVQYVTIPSECPAKLDWLFEQVSQP